MKALIATALAAATVSTFAAPALQNSGFEAPNLGAGQWVKGQYLAGMVWNGVSTWGFANGNGAWGAGPHTGAQYGFVQSENADASVAGSMYQTMSGFDIGASYCVDFWMAKRLSGWGADYGNNITVLVDSNVILGPIEPTEDGLWNEYQTGPFVATSSSTTITFQGEPLHDITWGWMDNTSLIDDVSVLAAPEPATLMGVAFGLAALGLRRRRS